MAWAFEDYLLDLDRRELWRGHAQIKIEPQVLDLLAYLVAHRGRVIGKDELFQEIWHGRIVSDSALTTRLNAARRAVGDDGKTQRLIRTFSRKGFRFVGEIREAAPLQGLVAPGPPAVVNRPAEGTSRDERSAVAVLPFRAISGDAEEQRLANSLAGDVSLALYGFRWFSVIGPALYPNGQDRPVDLKRVGWELGARYAVQGAVWRRGDRLRVTAHLIETRSGSQLWGERFEDWLANGFAFQDRVAATIAGSIEPPLRIAEAARGGPAGDRAATPYRLHLQAHPIFSDGKASVVRSLSLLERALALDPDYAPALADAAFCLQVLDINCGGDLDRQAIRRKAVAMARKALGSSDDPEPMATAAFALAYFGDDMGEARALLDHALSLNPSFARGWYMSGMARLYAGEPEDAIEALGTALRLSPKDRLTQRNHAGLGIAHLFMGHIDEAVPSLRLMVHEFPRWATPYAALASCYEAAGASRDAVAVAARLKSVDGSLIPNAEQFRNPQHRALLAPGVRLGGNPATV